MMRVLVIEDDEPIADLLSRSLAFAGHEVETAQDGEEGLVRWSVGGFGAVILDVMLPGISGLEVCATRRLAGDATPVLLLTARDEDALRAQAIEAGASAVMLKPFVYAELVSWLASVEPGDRSR
jgi:DNA-binding response OmpR family regulator